MSSSSSESEGEAERLREAVQVAEIRGGSSSAKKKNGVPSSRQPSHQDGECEGLVSASMQTFLAKKLGQLLDSQYELTVQQEPTNARVAGSREPEDGIRLLSASQHPVSMEPFPSHTRLQSSHSASNNVSDSEEESEETKRLESAVIDAQTIISQSKRTQGHS